MDPTEYHNPVEPTQTAYDPYSSSYQWNLPSKPPEPYEPTQIAPPLAHYGTIPPSPTHAPRVRRQIWSIVSALTLVLALVGATVWVMFEGIHPTIGARPTPQPARPVVATRTPVDVLPTPSPTIEPTIDTNYTAMNIVGYMQAIDKTVSIESQNQTIWEWSHDNYFINVHAKSSVQFSGCPQGDCADTWHYGLWVYASPQDTQSAWQQVTVDSQNCTDTSPASSGMHVVCGMNETEYAHGRCLLLNANDLSIYGQVVTRYCI